MPRPRMEGWRREYLRRMRDAEGKSVRQIAAEMGIPRSTVARELNRADEPAAAPPASPPVVDSTPADGAGTPEPAQGLSGRSAWQPATPQDAALAIQRLRPGPYPLRDEEPGDHPRERGLAGWRAIRW